jgi:hypothetical protein
MQSESESESESSASVSETKQLEPADILSNLNAQLVDQKNSVQDMFNKGIERLQLHPSTSFSALTKHLSGLSTPKKRKSKRSSTLITTIPPSREILQDVPKIIVEQIEQTKLLDFQKNTTSAAAKKREKFVSLAEKTKNKIRTKSSIKQQKWRSSLNEETKAEIKAKDTASKRDMRSSLDEEIKAEIKAKDAASHRERWERENEEGKELIRASDAASRRDVRLSLDEETKADIKAKDATSRRDVRATEDDAIKERIRVSDAEQHRRKHERKKALKAETFEALQLKFKENPDYFPTEAEFNAGVERNDPFVQRLLFHENSWKPEMFMTDEEIKDLNEKQEVTNDVIVKR